MKGINATGIWTRCTEISMQSDLRGGKIQPTPPRYPKRSAIGQQLYLVYSHLFGSVQIVGFPFRVVLEHKMLS